MTTQPQREPLRGELHPAQLLSANPDVPPSTTETVHGGRRLDTQPERLHHLLDRLLRGVLLPEEAEQLAELVRKQEQRLDDWKQAAGAGMTLADELRTEIHALTLGVPLICSDDRHKTQVLAQAIRISELAAVVARVRRVVDAGPVGSCCAHLIRAALTPPVSLCGCGRPDPGPCTLCPAGSPSLHCACTCEPAETAA